IEGWREVCQGFLLSSLPSAVRSCKYFVRFALAKPVPHLHNRKLFYREQTSLQSYFSYHIITFHMLQYHTTTIQPPQLSSNPLISLQKSAMLERMTAINQ